MKNFISGLSILLLAACASVPKDLSVADNEILIGFAEEVNSPGANQGLSARWGGVIAKVENKAKDTVIEVVNFTLNSSARPKQSDKTLGRFRIRYQGFLDPMIYQQGKSITGVGTIGKAEAGKIGEHKYTFPVLNANKVHLWKKIKPVESRLVVDPFWYSPASYWGYPYYSRPIIIKKTPAKATNKSK